MPQCQDTTIHCPPTGITNHDEYSLVRELMEEKKEEVTGTLRKDKTLLRDEKKMEKLKQKLHTDDECESGRRGRWQPRVHPWHHPNPSPFAPCPTLKTEH